MSAQQQQQANFLEGPMHSFDEFLGALSSFEVPALSSFEMADISSWQLPSWQCCDEYFPLPELSIDDPATQVSVCVAGAAATVGLAYALRSARRDQQQVSAAGDQDKAATDSVKVGAKKASKSAKQKAAKKNLAKAQAKVKARSQTPKKAEVKTPKKVEVKTRSKTPKASKAKKN